MPTPEDRQYTAEHEWIQVTDGIGLVGLTSFATSALGDVVYVDLPPIGSTITAGVPCGEVESTKSVSDLVAPVTGEVVEVNTAVAEDPSLTNSAPYTTGWLYRVRVESAPTHMTATEYELFTGGS